MGRLPSEIMMMPLADFDLLRGFYAHSPFGDVRSDTQAGIIASTIANSFRGKHTSPYKASDFMPFTQQDNSADVGIEQKINEFMKTYH